MPGLFGVGRSRRPRRIGHLLENLPQHTRRAHPLREGQPQRRAIELKLETLGVAAHAAPFAVASAHELGSIETHRLGMIAKVVNLRTLRAQEPAVRMNDTFNAEVNAHMIAINEAMGFRAVDRWANWQASVA